MFFHVGGVITSFQMPYLPKNTAARPGLPPPDSSCLVKPYYFAVRLLQGPEIIPQSGKYARTIPAPTDKGSTAEMNAVSVEPELESVTALSAAETSLVRTIALIF